MVMKKEIIDISEMSDSKEVYGHRPNPFMPGFVYSIVGLLIVAIVFSLIGTIDIVTTASGIIRPNGNISTVAGSVGGRIEEVYLSEGKCVEEGDVLYTIDMSETEKELEILLNDKEETDFRLECLGRFAQGLDSGVNPFSSDPLSPEYPYYVRFGYVDLSLLEARNGYSDSQEERRITLEDYENRMTDLKQDVSGLEAFEKSVTDGENNLQAYPEYESQYLAYSSGLDALKLEYESGKQQLESDNSEASAEYYLSLYKNQIEGYETLLKAVEFVGTNLSWAECDENGDYKSKGLSEILAEPCMKKGGVYRGLFEAYLSKLRSCDTNSESSQAAIETYLGNARQEYEQKKLEYENKLADLELNYSGNKSAEDLLKELQEQYDAARSQKYYSALVEARSIKANLESEISAAQENLQLYRNMKTGAGTSAGNDGNEPEAVTAERMTALATMISNRNTITAKADAARQQREAISDPVGQGDLVASLNSAIAAYENELTMIDKYTEGLTTGVNPFSSDPASPEFPYYVQFKNYELTIKNIRDTGTYDISEIDLKIRSCEAVIESKQQSLAGADLYIDSIVSGWNKVKDYPQYNEYYRLYSAELTALKNEYDSNCESIRNNKDGETRDYYAALYEKQIEGYSWLIKKIEEYGKTQLPEETAQEKPADEFVTIYDNLAANLAEYERENETAGRSLADCRLSVVMEYTEQIEELRIKSEDIRLQKEGVIPTEKALASLEADYTNKYDQQYYQKLAQIESSKTSSQLELTDLEAKYEMLVFEQNRAEEQSDDNGDNLQILLAIKEQENQLVTEIENLKSQSQDLSDSIEKMQEKLELGTIRAQVSGVINLSQELTAGDILTAGTPVATIVPQNESRFKVQIYVSNSDIGNIHVNDKVKYNIAALPSNQYGSVNGTVTGVGSDVMLNDGEYSGYYLVEADIENRVLTDKDGNSGSIGIGMQTEVKIVTQEKSIFRYLLEKIDLW